jgi:hypothetical protein
MIDDIEVERKFIINNVSIEENIDNEIILEM